MNQDVTVCITKSGIALFGQKKAIVKLHLNIGITWIKIVGIHAVV